MYISNFSKLMSNKTQLHLFVDTFYNNNNQRKSNLKQRNLFLLILLSLK